MPESVSVHNCVCPSVSHRQQQQHHHPCNRLSCLSAAGLCEHAQPNSHTNLLPGSLGFYFPPDNWDIVLFIALQHTQAQQLSAWNSYGFILGTQNALQLVWAKMFTFKPKDPFPSSLLSLHPLTPPAPHCAPAPIARIAGPQAEQVQAAVMVALQSHTHTHTSRGYTRGRRLGCGAILSEMADPDCLLERRKGSVLVVFGGFSREWAGV